MIFKIPVGGYLFSWGYEIHVVGPGNPNDRKIPWQQARVPHSVMKL